MDDRLFISPMSVVFIYFCDVFHRGTCADESVLLDS
jgi:hypothetical protein